MNRERKMNTDTAQWIHSTYFHIKKKLNKNTDNTNTIKLYLDFKSYPYNTIM